MGMVVHRDGKPFVFEASATVRYTPLQSWIDRGEHGHYVVKRLRESAGRITPKAMEKARVLARQFQGKNYDLTFEWSDTRMYCSELVWKIYDRVLGIRIGKLQKLRDFDLRAESFDAALAELKTHLPDYTFLGTWLEASRKIIGGRT